MGLIVCFVCNPSSIGEGLNKQYKIGIKINTLINTTMNCRVILFNEKNNKTIKEFIISCESYSLCEDKVKKLNEDIQYPKRYKLTHINI